MTWIAVAVGAVGIGTSIYGANKQASAAKNAANLNMDQFHLLNQQQQPYIQSGYGALGRLNTLLGLSPNPNQNIQSVRPNPGTTRMFAGGPAGDPSGAWRPTPGGGIQPTLAMGPQQMYAGGQGGDPNGGNMQLRQILALRAAHGDTQAGRMLGMV